jgi:hypothetical protein
LLLQPTHLLLLLLLLTLLLSPRLRQGHLSPSK